MTKDKEKSVEDIAKECAENIHFNIYEVEPNDILEGMTKDCMIRYFQSERDKRKEAEKAFKIAAGVNRFLSDDSVEDNYIKSLESKLSRAVEALEKISVQPYPIDLFTPIPDGEFKELDQWCQSRGYRIDNLSADIGRNINGWIIEEAKQTLKEIGE